MTGSATDQAGVAELVEAADAAARAAAPAEDAAELVRDRGLRRLGRRAGPTDIDVYDASPRRSARRSAAPRPAGRVLYGFVNHEVTTTYLGSTTGLRLRHVQPTGHFGCTGKSADLTTQRLGRRARPATSPTSTRSRSTPSWPSGWAGPSAGSTCRPAATTRSCRRPRWPT